MKIRGRKGHEDGSPTRRRRRRTRLERGECEAMLLTLEKSCVLTGTRMVVCVCGVADELLAYAFKAAGSSMVGRRLLASSATSGLKGSDGGRRSAARRIDLLGEDAWLSSSGT